MYNDICFKSRWTNEHRWNHNKYDTQKMFRIWTQGPPPQGEWDMPKIGSLVNEYEQLWLQRSNEIVNQIQMELLNRLAAAHITLQNEFNAQAAQCCVKQD
jgi:uncharacterized caspase-like protein